jgi:hypothetical protein
METVMTNLPAVRKPSVCDSGCSTPALDRALAVLEFVSLQAQGVRQTEICAALGMTSNMVFRITKSLVTHGYLECDPSSKRYRLTGTNYSRWPSPGSKNEAWFRWRTNQCAN